ncbi:sulfatase-like hydrolase/transferase [Desulfovibrio sp. JC010]|uniref:sulfatase-like hydrolase/transferase n=1 Tax=Desulfovibrio sp. JC010 TaxID=2593641 RepID=UPI0013D66A2E|nr:sulfatase-like hydrolase/transferase [Desulfovibrio sp. JC010]NDV27682.1 sulfatase-like hydrolase/transferase [Desulfovibrio sp. JC010]
MGNKKSEASRRNFIKMAGVGLLASTLHASAGKAHAEPVSAPKQPDSPHKIAGKGYNVVLIVTDQERHFKQWPQSAELSTREKIKSAGVSFENHYNCSNMCTSSRSVMYTGQHVQHTGMFDNTNLPWQPDMSTELPTIGDMMRKLGYYTAYKGKVHLSEAITPEANKEHKLMTDAMEPYGFSDFNPTGDHYGKTLGGYTHDMNFAGDAANWLRSKGAPLNEKGQPFFLAVNMINPHDVMYFDTDAAGQDEQLTSNGKLVDPINRAPENSVYQEKHKDFPLPNNLYQPVREKGRPNAHYEYHYGWDYLVGTIPDTDAHWTRYRDYYLNCLKDVDMQIGTVIDELERQGMRENTVIIFTADHGEMGGNHNLRGKGPFSYEENIHVPMFIIHPEIRGGQSTDAITSHLDLAPTILNLTGAKEKEIDKITSSLPGEDMTPVLADPGKAKIDSVRSGALHCFNMILTVDGNFIRKTAECYDKGINWMREKNIKPDLTKRGNIRIIFDGRYKFARYFSPLKRNTPQTWAELTGLNDLELYDLKNDPQEMHNLATVPEKNKSLILRMNKKLNDLIAKEVGKDAGPELKDYENWAVTDLNH